MRSTTSPPRDLLALARAQKAAEDRAAAELLVIAARWADLHPPESIHYAAAFTVPGCEHEEPIAGEGAPLVAEFCLAELGTVLGISTTAAKKLVGHALELRHRLPRLWAQVQAGRVPAWRARAVAEVTIHTDPGADASRQPGSSTPRSPPSPVGSVRRSWTGSSPRRSSASTSPASIRPRIRRTATSTSTRATPPIHDDDVHYAGTMRFEAELDIADALDLDRALAHGAATLKALGSDRVAATCAAPKALGDLARTQTALDLHTQGATGARDADGLPAAREVVLHAHFDASLDGLDHGVRSDRPDGGGPAAGPPRPGQGLVRRLPHEGHRQAGHRPQRRPLDTGVRGARPDPRAGDPPGSHVRVPVVHPTGPGLRHRPRHRVRPRRRSRRPTTARPDADRQPRRAVPVPPPPQDPHRLALPR